MAGSALQMDKIKLLALDQSSKVSGFAIFEDGRYSSHGKFTFDGEIGERLVKIRRQVMALVHENNITEVAFEDIQHQENRINNVQTFKVLAEVYGVIQELLTEMRVKYTIVPASTWKSSLGIKGAVSAEQKRNAQKYVFDTYGIKATQDECDAICIASHMSKSQSMNFNWD